MRFEEIITNVIKGKCGNNIANQFAETIHNTSEENILYQNRLAMEKIVDVISDLIDSRCFNRDIEFELNAYVQKVCEYFDFD